MVQNSTASNLSDARVVARPERDRASPLTACEHAVLDFLGRKRVWVDRDRLDAFTRDASRLYDHAAPARGPGTLRVLIYRIRQKLGADAILCMVDGGRSDARDVRYTLGAPGVSAWRAKARAA